MPVLYPDRSTSKQLDKLSIRLKISSLIGAARPLSAVEHGGDTGSCCTLGEAERSRPIPSLERRGEEPYSAPAGARKSSR